MGISNIHFTSLVNQFSRIIHYMSATVADLIRDAFPVMPKAERRVAHEVLSSYPVAGLETVARLAQRSSVSGPTVIRFASRLGFTGFPEFQEALISELDERNASPLLQFETKVNPGVDVVDRSRTVLSDSLNRSLELLDRGAFSAAVEMLTKSPGRIVTAGGRFSGITMQMFARHLEILRPSTRHLDASDWETFTLDVRRNDTMVLADFRRYQRTTITFGREWKQRGANLILLTDPWMSPLAVDADIVLTAAVESPSPFDSQVAALGVIESLIAAVTDALGDKARQRITEYDVIWDRQDFRYTEASTQTDGEN